MAKFVKVLVQKAILFQREMPDVAYFWTIQQ